MSEPAAYTPFESRKGTTIRFTMLDSCYTSATLLGKKVLRLDSTDGYPDRYLWITKPFSPGLAECCYVTTRWFWRFLAKIVGLWYETKSLLREAP